jgi:hypothetical protein
MTDKLFLIIVCIVALYVLKNRSSVVDQIIQMNEFMMPGGKYNRRRLEAMGVIVCLGMLALAAGDLLGLLPRSDPSQLSAPGADEPGHANIFAAMDIAFGLVLLATVSALLFNVVAKYLITYSTHTHHMSVNVLGVSVATIRYSEIVDVSVLAEGASLWFGFGLRTLRLSNRIRGRGLIISRSASPFSGMVISPDDPEQFASTLSTSARHSPP